MTWRSQGEEKMHELEYLRSELIQRISYSYEQPHKILGHLLLLWGGTLTLFSMSKINFMEDIFLFFIVSTIFFISVIMIYFFSKREYENLAQIFRIAAYNTIFGEKEPSANKGYNVFCWELAIFKEMKKEKEKPNLKRNYEMNNEYIVLSIISILINSFLLFLLFFKFPATLQCITWPDYVIIGLCFCYIVTSVFLVIPIHKNASLNPQKWFDTKKMYLNSFLKYAIDTSYYTEDEAEKRFGKEFFGEIYNFEPNKK